MNDERKGFEVRTDASNPDLEDIRGALQGEWRRQVPDRAASPSANVAQWKQAIDYELVMIQLTADSFATPREAVHALINWHVSVALDPAVSRQAQALIDKGKADAANVAQGVEAWVYEFATAIDDDGRYCNWCKALEFEPPNIPEGTVRNLSPLIYAAPQSSQPVEAGEAVQVDQIPCGWIRGVESYVPGEPTEWNVEFSWGDDEPEDGHKWEPVYRSPAAPAQAGEAKRFPTPISISTEKICEIAGKYNLGNPRLDALRCFVNEIIIVNEAEYA